MDLRFGEFVAGDPAIDGYWRESGETCELGSRHCHAVVGDENIACSIVGLLLVSGPPAIIGLVVPFAFDPINRVEWGWAS